MPVLALVMPTYLEVQGSNNQARSVAINQLQAPQVELARSYLGYTYSYRLVLATLDLQAEGTSGDAEVGCNSPGFWTRGGG